MTSPSPSEAEGSRIALTSARWRGAGLLSPLRGGGEPDALTPLRSGGAGGGQIPPSCVKIS
jgi:hypothetical protein